MRRKNNAFAESRGRGVWMRRKQHAFAEPRGHGV